MSYESSAHVKLAELSAGQLVDTLERSVRAVTGIDGNGDYGGIATLDNVANPHNIDDIGPYIPGSDAVHDINIVETLASRHVAANKGRGDERPRKYHAVVEYGDRYLSATGVYTLKALARIALGTVTMAAKGESAEMRTVAVSEGQKPLIIDDETLTPTWTVKRYDEYTKKQDRPDPTNCNRALANGLEGLRAGDTLQPNTDVCVVVSDFLSGAQYDSDGKLGGFNWQRPLRYLQQELGDRLLVMRLTTSAQRELPYVRTFVDQGKPMTMDFDEYLRNNERYARLTTQKAERISSILCETRLLELDSTDKAPLAIVPQFIFGQASQED